MTEIEKTKKEIEVLTKKLSFLEELEQTKSPAEEAYKAWWGEYPSNTWQCDVTRWEAFQMGYNAAYEEKVSEWQPTPQTPEQVADGLKEALKEAFREAVKQGVVSSTKSKTLTDLIYRWWSDVFTTHSDWDMETSIEDLVDQIEMWLPKEQSAESSQNAYVESAVEGFNDCLTQIKGKLR
jgi:hypothetical protein